MEVLLDHVQRGIVNVLLLSMPVVLTAASIGLVVGILQAVTQVQEQTISAAPKILAVFLVLMLLGKFYAERLAGFTIHAVRLATEVIPKDDIYLLGPGEDLNSENSFFNKEPKIFSSGKNINVKEMMKSPMKYPSKGKKNAPFTLKVPPQHSSGANIVEKKQLKKK